MWLILWSSINLKMASEINFFAQRLIQSHALLFQLHGLFCLFVVTSTRIHLFCKLFFLSYLVWSPLQWPCFRFPHLHIFGVNIWHLGSALVTPSGYIRLSTAGIRQRQQVSAQQLSGDVEQVWKRKKSCWSADPLSTLPAAPQGRDGYILWLSDCVRAVMDSHKGSEL